MRLCLVSMREKGEWGLKSTPMGLLVLSNYASHSYIRSKSRTKPCVTIMLELSGFVITRLSYIGSQVCIYSLFRHG